MPKTWPSPILEKIFSRSKIARNIPKIICRKSPLLQIFIELFPCISLFFRTKLTIKHGSIVNKTDFCSRNSLKIAGTADFCRRNGMSISSCTLYFIMKFCTLMQNANVWNVTEPDFRKNVFSRPKMPEICRKSPFLQILFGFFPYISLFFYLKTLLITMPTIKHGSFVS